MNRAENEIEFVPILLNPGSTRGASLRIVIELDASANLHIGIRGAKLADLNEVDSGVEAVVIGKRDVVQPSCPSTVDPRLQQFLRIRLNSMTLRVGVVIGKKSRRHGSVMNFCRMRSSGYFGKKTSAVKTFPGVRS